MDIRKPQSEPKTESESKQKSNSSNTSDSSSKLQYKAGQITRPSAKLMLPPAVQGKLSAITQEYGIPFDLSNISLAGLKRKSRSNKGIIQAWQIFHIKA